MDASLTTRPVETDLAAEVAAAGETPLPGMRLWFAIFVLWAIVLTLTARAAFAQYEQGSAVAAGVWVLALMCFYLSLCNALLPLPTAWIVMLAATNLVADYAPPWARVLLVAVLGGLATTVSNLNEYHILSHPVGRRLRDRVRNTRAYRWAIQWFNRAPFAALALMAFIPIPVDVIRWLAILRRYARPRFAAAYFIGRGGRYLIFATLSVIWQLSGMQILGVQVAIVLLAALGRVAWQIARPAQRAPRPPDLAD